MKKLRPVKKPYDNTKGSSMPLGLPVGIFNYSSDGELKSSINDSLKGRAADVADKIIAGVTMASTGNGSGDSTTGSVSGVKADKS